MRVRRRSSGGGLQPVELVNRPGVKIAFQVLVQGVAVKRKNTRLPSFDPRARTNSGQRKSRSDVILAPDRQ